MPVLSKVEILTLSQQFKLIYVDTVLPTIKLFEEKYGKHAFSPRFPLRKSRHFWTGIMKNFWDLARSDIVSSCKDIKHGVIRRRRAQRRRQRRRDRMLNGTIPATGEKPIPVLRKEFSFDQVGGWGDFLVDRYMYYPSTLRQAFPLVDRILTEAEEVQSTSSIRPVSPSGSTSDRTTSTTRTVGDATIRELGAALQDVLKWKRESPMTYISFLMSHNNQMEGLPEDVLPRLVATLGITEEINRPLLLSLRYVVDHVDVYDMSGIWDITFLSLVPSVRAILSCVESVRLVLTVAWRVLNVFTLGIPALINYVLGKIPSMTVIWNGVLLEIQDRNMAPYKWLEDKCVRFVVGWFATDPLSSLFEPEEARQEARALERELETADAATQTEVVVPEFRTTSEINAQARMLRRFGTESQNIFEGMSNDVINMLTEEDDLERMRQQLTAYGDLLDPNDFDI